MELKRDSQFSDQQLRELRGHFVTEKPKITLEDLLENSPEGSFGSPCVPGDDALCQDEAVDNVNSMEAIAAFLADAIKTRSWNQVKEALKVTELALNRVHTGDCSKAGYEHNNAPAADDVLKSWDSFFKNEETVSDDFMADRTKRQIGMIQKVSPARRITLSESQCIELGIKPGDHVETFIQDNRLQIVKKQKDVTNKTKRQR
ncbi:hypothetical protein [Endozoicomonas sp. Mp262]|uniref:hypothetical protein n=1 Tax=Endozoicomonas sp. Mp262 TaxID=2919499 RepID=UPI0021DB0622